MPVTNIAEGFSVSHAQVLDGGTAFIDALSLGSAFDVYGVDRANISPQGGDFVNQGDDVALSNWSWVEFAELEVRGGYFSFPLIETLTGRTMTSSGTDPAIHYEMDIWHEDDSNVQARPMLIRIPSRDSEGNVRLLDIGLYRVDFKPIVFEGPQYKDGLKVSYSGRAAYSATDEEGNAFGDGKRRIARVMSRPAS